MASLGHMGAGQPGSSGSQAASATGAVEEAQGSEMNPAANWFVVLQVAGGELQLPESQLAPLGPPCRIVRLLPPDDPSVLGMSTYVLCNATSPKDGQAARTNYSDLPGFIEFLKISMVPITALALNQGVPEH